LISSQSPVDLDWDFTSGLLHVAASRETQLRAALQTSQPVRLNGEPVSEIGQEAGLAVFHLPPGRHKIEGAKLASAGWEDLASRLADLLVLGRQNRARAAAALAVKTAAQSPLLTTAMTANVGGPVTDLLPLPSEAGGAVYAAEGKTIHCLSREGKELQALEADGPVRMLRWWSEHCLLLAGCADEQVIAYDLSGKRKWVFTSEMDPAVFRAAKTYWFKSAPGHEGIHGLHTGLFLNGKSQAFVGSACTLEIIDQHGKLIRRMPQFWGKVSHFAIIDGPGGTLNLLASRKYNGTNDAAIINNQTLDPDPRGFESVPPGCTHVPGWSSMNRHHLFYEDLDGDGVKEVVSETNGTWNRVTVWRADGQPLYDASFGPGERIPARNMRDLDVADLDGDGRKEILAATSAGLVVALDRQCRKRWAVRLAGAPTVMKCVQPAHSAAPWIVIGCQDGAVEVLDGKGTPVRSAKVQGSPTCIEVLHDAPNGPWVVLATDQGEVAAFQAAQ
jgi:outer membrane protein assembly factor BamB